MTKPSNVFEPKPNDNADDLKEKARIKALILNEAARTGRPVETICAMWLDQARMAGFTRADVANLMLWMNSMLWALQQDHSATCPACYCTCDLTETRKILVDDFKAYIANLWKNVEGG